MFIARWESFIALGSLSAINIFLSCIWILYSLYYMENGCLTDVFMQCHCWAIIQYFHLKSEIRIIMYINHRGWNNHPFDINDSNIYPCRYWFITNIWFFLNICLHMQLVKIVIRRRAKMQYIFSVHLSLSL